MGKDREQNNNPESIIPQEATLTPQEIGFIKDAKKVIRGHLARTILVASAVLAGAGVIAVEKTGSFNPLASHVGSANHLVINNLHESYKQLIDMLPEAEKAEANAITVTFNFKNNSGSPQNDMYIDFHDDDPGNSNQDAIFVRGDLTCSPDSGNSPDHKWNCSSVAPITSNAPDGSGCSDTLVCIAEERFTYDCSANAHLIAVMHWGTRPSGSGNGAGAQEGSAAGSCSVGVGGIAELPNVKALPQESAQSSDNEITPFEIGGAVAVATALTAAGAALHSRRKRSS